MALNICLSAVAGNAVPVDFRSDQISVVPQAQVFYSPYVSRIADSTQQGCMVSVGSDWKDSGQARYALEMEAFLSRGYSLDEAYARSSVVKIDRLSSNTPFMAFVRSADGAMFLRVAVGFHIAEGSFRLSWQGNEISAVAEPRGDSVVISDKDEVDRLFAAFAGGSLFTVSARSQKQGDKAVEHYLRYSFEGRSVVGEFERCIADLSVEEARLNVAVVPSFGLRPQVSGDVRSRIEMRAMACNRELDPEVSEIVKLDGLQAGFVSPLGHALLTRDNEGQIVDIWSGDLWRISRTPGGYAIAFSNSIIGQGPFESQNRKACTRFGNAACVNLVELEQGALLVEQCFEPQFASAGYFSGGDDIALFPAAATFSNIGTSGVAIASSSPALGRVLRASSVSRIVAGTPEEEDIESTDQYLSLIPVPAAFVFGVSILLVFAIIIGAKSLAQRST